CGRLLPPAILGVNGPVGVAEVPLGPGLPIWWHRAGPADFLPDLMHRPQVILHLLVRLCRQGFRKLVLSLASQQGVEFLASSRLKATQKLLDDLTPDAVEKTAVLVVRSELFEVRTTVTQGVILPGPATHPPTALTIEESCHPQIRVARGFARPVDAVEF